jgi:hypothetical protein
VADDDSFSYVQGSSTLIFVMMLGQFLEEGSPAQRRA